ncbi:MAG: methyltransferase domain-containing protein, partial [Candidatus Omnitrophica bacterium]|nr:methyltransferase domain-containing protein [Candidatus Omnitrophota bacterium]
MRNVIRLSSEELARLDLLRFNGGVSPYPENDTTIASAFTRRNADYYREYVEKTKFMNGGAVLDLGCGIGNWSLFLAECNERVIGIDRNAGCVNLARNMASDLGVKNLEFLCADLTNLTMQLPNGQFDYVWLWSVLQYVERGAAMREISRLLKKG